MTQQSNRVFNGGAEVAHASMQSARTRDARGKTWFPFPLIVTKRFSVSRVSNLCAEKRGNKNEVKKKTN
jgi:hypothetical protein